MADDIAIRVENLSKRYRIGAKEEVHDTFASMLSDWVKRPAHNLRGLRSLTRFTENGQEPEDIIWALKEVSFEVKRGEVVGIIGRNGAGKSTLLKILSRITHPTSGRVELNGRVSSLLEIGTGFHQELTGRENIYLNGTILGMRKAEIDRKFDEIVDFSGVEKFIDTPVKRYSSGMRVRLAFSVAAFLEPEILLVDEVLAVGDIEFQKKGLGRMGEVAEEGRTVLFVSHNMQAISSLTEKSILIETGQIQFEGATPEAIRHYRELWNNIGQRAEYINDAEKAGLRRARVITSEPNQIHHFGKPLAFEFEITFLTQLKSAAFSFQILDEKLNPIVHLWFFDSEKPWSKIGIVRLLCIVNDPKLYMGKYSLKTHLADRSGNEKYETLESICSFEVVMDGLPREYMWEPGMCTYLEEAEWSIVSQNR